MSGGAGGGPPRSARKTPCRRFKSESVLSVCLLKISLIGVALPFASAIPYTPWSHAPRDRHLKGLPHGFSQGFSQGFSESGVGEARGGPGTVRVMLRVCRDLRVVGSGCARTKRPCRSFAGVAPS